MRAFAVFDIQTGRGVRQGQCQDGHWEQQYDEATQVIYEGDYIHDHWYDSASDSLIPRDPSPVTIDRTEVLVGETVTLSNIPVGAEMLVGREMVTVDDGVLIVTFDTIGGYSIKFSHIKYLRQIWEVVVNE